MIECTMNDRQILRQWMQATWWGWLLGIPVIALLALLGEAVSLGGSQALVGLGMGASIGVMQARTLRGVLAKPIHWVWACLLGLGLPFLLYDAARAAGWNYPYNLYLFVALGGLLVGCLQAVQLGKHHRRHWIIASLAGWALAAGAVALTDQLPRKPPFVGLSGLIIFIGLVALGGLVLGLVTGSVLPRSIRAMTKR